MTRIRSCINYNTAASIISEVVTDGVTIEGDGTSGSPLAVPAGVFDAAGSAAAALSAANAYTDAEISQISDDLNAKLDVFITTRTLGAGHTLDAADLTAINEGKNYLLNTSVPGVLTIPLNATVDFEVSSSIWLEDFTTVAGVLGVTVNGTNGTLDVVGRSLIEQISIDTWTLYNGEPAASASTAGITKLYTNLSASNTDGAPSQAAVKAVTDLKEAVANKATGFGTLNDTLYPTVQAVATYVSTLTGGGYSDVAFVNNYAGVDPTGATDSKTGLQAAMASGKKIIVFDGLYRTTDVLTLNSGQIVLLRGGTTVTLYGNVNTGTSLFLMASNSYIYGEAGSHLTHTPTGTAAYSGVYALNKSLWGVVGKIKISGFGNQGIRIQGTDTSTSATPYKNGIIQGVICQANINTGSGAGHGIRIHTATEYVYIIDCECYENGGFGILNEGGANNPIINTKMMKNVLGGMKLMGDYVNNTDHFQVVGCQINHNDAVGTFNVWVTGVDTGINFTGCSIYGGDSFKVENSRGVTFNGCGMSTGTNNHVIPGTDGDGVVYINGGHILGNSIENMKTALRGGGMVVFNNVRETQYPATTYSSDFSAGVNSWADNGTTITGNIDSISDGNDTFSNTLRIAGDGNNSTHFASRATTLTVGNKYKIVVTLYILAANTDVDGIRLTDSGGLSEDFSFLRTGKWITVEKDFTALGTTLQLSLLDGTVDSFTAPVGDLVYIARIKVFQR